MNPVTSESEYMARPIDETRIEKYERGIREHRGGDATAPFKGNILFEASEECRDLINLLIEDGQTTGDTNWTPDISYVRQIATKLRAVYFRRLGRV